jgi:hypothetical protein
MTALAFPSSAARLVREHSQEHAVSFEFARHVHPGHVPKVMLCKILM